MKVKNSGKTSEEENQSLSLDSASKQEFLDSHLSDLQKNNDTFVTVINVSNEQDKAASLPSGKSKNRDSLRSVSSPTTPTSPLISSSTEDFISREGLAAVNTSSISSSSASSKEQIEDEEADRGQPDGHDDPNDQKKAKTVPKDESNR